MQGAQGRSGCFVTHAVLTYGRSGWERDNTMKIEIRILVAGLAAFGTLAAPMVAAAQSRSAVVTRPAVVEAPATTVAANAPTRNASPVRGAPAAIIPVTPTPLPPLPPNFCNRGNSSGVSRC